MARGKLIEGIKQKAYELGITKTTVKEMEVYQDGFLLNQKLFSRRQMEQREKLVRKMRSIGYDQLIEEVAYTWFNRFIAIRFMEVNDYLPTGVRILSSLDKQKIEPDSITEVFSIVDDLDLDLELVYRYQDLNNTEELFKYILVKQCNKLGEVMPVMFEKIEDYTELLLPDPLLAEGSVVRLLVSMIEEKDWHEHIEIIGWLYQHYISEKKEEVDKLKGRIAKENLPAKTQLFTPKWIVMYMIENSLGRMGLSVLQDKSVTNDYTYYLEHNQKEDIVPLSYHLEEIRIMDPSMGSGHILVTAFDILYKLYQHAGYSERKIPQLIIENNLFGLDIDDRAAQLAYFSILMKARSYDRRILQKQLQVNITSIKETNESMKEAFNYLANDMSDSSLTNEVQYLYEVYQNGKEIGSLLNIREIHIEAIEVHLRELQTRVTDDLFQEQYIHILLDIMPGILKQTKILLHHYHVVCTNPPYLGGGKVSSVLSKYLATHYRESKRDLYTAFMEKCLSLTVTNGYTAMITQEPWMFAAAFDKFRYHLLQQAKIINLLHLGTRTFEEISGEVVKSTAFIMKKEKPDTDNHFPLFVDLTGFDTKRKEKEIFNSDYWYTTLPQDIFTKIPKYPICYWATKDTLDIFNEEKTIPFKAGRSLQTGNDPLFVRYWHEVDINQIALKKMDSSAKWFLFNKGGTYRKWYGNNEHILFWENNGDKIKQMHQDGEIKATLRNLSVFFQEGVTYTYITSGDFSARYSSDLFTYSGAGPAIMTEDHYYLLGFVNSKVFNYLVRLFKGETERYESGDVEGIPLLEMETQESYKEVIDLVKRAISLSKEDWDEREQSYDFQKHPYLQHKGTVDEITREIISHQKQRMDELKRIEEQINRIMIKRYHMEDQLDSSVPEHKLSVKIEDECSLIKSFISYAVGCILGRYSLDREGICFAGGTFNSSLYHTFRADQDNIIPITDDEYFEDDMVARFIQFLTVLFGRDTLEENLDYISNILTKKANETSRQRIRRYFLKEFYSDHVKAYQKCPIYWLFDSGKNNGFKALIYIHRYDAGMVARVRTDYLHRLQVKYESEIARMEMLQEADVSEQEKTNAKKQKEKLLNQQIECQQYDQVIAHVANKQVLLNLDEGIKVNYAKFQNVKLELTETNGVAKDLLAKI